MLDEICSWILDDRGSALDHDHGVGLLLFLEPIETRELSFDGFEQKAGELTDFLDNPLPEINQAYERWIEIQESSISVDFGSITSVNCLVYNIYTQDSFTGSEQFPVMIPMEAVP